MTDLSHWFQWALSMATVFREFVGTADAAVDSQYGYFLETVMGMGKGFLATDIQ